MSAVARLSQMPDWPARMTADVAALFLGISIGAFRQRVAAGSLPAGISEGGNVLWSRRQLDAYVDAQFGLAKPLDRRGAVEVDTWADL